jgi:predicted ATPase
MEGSGETVTVFYRALDIAGLRGFGSRETVELAIPDGQDGSGLTILVGANNSGKSSVIEAFDAVYRATRQSAVSFAADRRHGGEEREVQIHLTRIDERSIGVETLRPGTSEARVVWDRDRSATDRITIEATVLPSRRQFAAYFGRYGEADRGWASSGASEFSRSQNRDGFVARLFALHEDDGRLATFNGLLREVTGRSLTWSIDLGAQQQYFLRFSEVGGGSHTSDGLGDGLISLLFILDALHDSTPSSLIVIDEPELSLHPQYVARLGALLARFASDRQIVFATHSPALVDWSYIANGARIARIYKAGGRSMIAQPQRATLSAIASGHLSNTHNPHVFGPRGNEVFFQEDGLLVLEGQEDVIYLPSVLESTGIRMQGSIFGWGAGGATQVAAVLALFRELRFEKVAVLLDGDDQTLKVKSRLKTEFPEYCIESHPADDIRTKPAQPQRASKPGLLTEDGKSVRPEHVADTTATLARIDAYLRTD